MADPTRRDIDRMQREMTHLVGHRLMNLLTPLVGLADLLEKRPSVEEDPQAAGLVASLRSSALLARDTVLQLRDVQMIEYGLRELNLRPGNLASLLPSVVKGIPECGNPSFIAMEMDIEGGEAMVEMDYDVLPHALRHLVKNACEHVQSGQDAEARAVSVRLREARDAFIIEVSNGGAPVPPEMLDTFFDKFNNGRNRKPGAVGLGTSFARAAAEAHGGAIDVSSGEESGTTVTLILPRKRAAGA